MLKINGAMFDKYAPDVRPTSNRSVNNIVYNRDMKRRRDTKNNPISPHISFKSIFYVMRIYHKAVGAKSFFFGFYRFYNSVIPSINAIIAGAIVSAIAEAVNTHDFTGVGVLLGIMFGIQLFGIIMDGLNNLLSVTTFEDVYNLVNRQVVLKYTNIPLNIRESREFADKFSRVKTFANSASSMTNGIFAAISAVISLISVIIATLTISPIITLVIALSTVPSSILTIRLSSKRRFNWREYTRDRRMANNIERKIIDSNNALEIEVNNLGGHLIERMIKANRRSQERDIADTRRYLWPQFGSSALETIANTGVMVFVAIKIVFDNLAIGQFFTIRTLLTQLSSNINMLFNEIVFVSENLVNATDYMEFMEAPEKTSGGLKITDTPTIEFKDVSFCYPNTSTKALDKVSFRLRAGESLAIVGENGAGKTTLIKLLIGAYEPSEGVILVNGEPFSRIDRESYLSQIGALFQDYSRYEFATLGENVWFGNPGKRYNGKEIERALEQADLATLSSSYEKGLDQILSKDYDEKSPADLSGGQWQRLAIARALFRAPNILLLDEPTSAIDAKAEQKIFHNIFEAQKSKTTVIISHRFSTIRRASHIIVLDHGRVVESGSHKELVTKRGGVYKALFEAQAEGYS